MGDVGVQLKAPLAANPDALIFQNVVQFSLLFTDVCAACGHADIHVKDAEQLAEKWRRLSRARHRDAPRPVAAGRVSLSDGAAGQLRRDAGQQ